MKKNEHWQVAYKMDGDTQFKTIANPKWAWAADPFLVEYDGKTILFAELFLYKSERNGVIGYCIWDGEKFGEWIVTMDKHWHLSYPNVWVENGNLYMCPESYQADEVAVYKLIQFPNKWQKVNTILQNFSYVDSTFAEHDGKRYMYTYKLLSKPSTGELHIYEIDRDYNILTDTIISQDLSNARPGGKVIKDGNTLIRVSQDCQDGYGVGIVFSKIIEMGETYKEEELKRIYPKDLEINTNKKIRGIHTYNKLGNMTVIDFKYEVFSLSEEMARKRVRKVFVDKY